MCYHVWVFNVRVYKPQREREREKVKECEKESEHECKCIVLISLKACHRQEIYFTRVYQNREYDFEKRQRPADVLLVFLRYCRFSLICTNCISSCHLYFIECEKKFKRKRIFYFFFFLGKTLFQWKIILWMVLIIFFSWYYFIEERINFQRKEETNIIKKIISILLSDNQCA